jgi:hypothetical protein
LSSRASKGFDATKPARREVYGRFPATKGLSDFCKRQKLNRSGLVLDDSTECDCMARMNTKIFAGLFGLAILAVGCVSTVTGGKTAAVPFVKDKIESRYERPPEQVFQAAKEVIAYNGALVTEGTLFGQTNAMGGSVKTIEGKVNQRTVWVRIEQVDPKVTAVAVQTRTSAGGTDIDLAAEIDKQIALKLVR